VLKIDQETIDLINESVSGSIKNRNLPAAIRVILKILSSFHPEKGFDELYDLLIFKSNPSLSFPKSDIEKVEFNISGNNVIVEITTNFLSIFGSSSPLPMHYNEKILQDANENRILTDFLDMLNHRLKRLIYQIWKKQRYHIEFKQDLSDRFSKYFLSIIGLYSQSKNRTVKLDIHRLLPLSGILSMQQKSAETIALILRYYFYHEKIYIQEFLVSKSKIPKSQFAHLGKKNTKLGQDISLGTFVLTRMHKIRIVFEDIEWSMLTKFSSNGGIKEIIEELMLLINKEQLEYEVLVSIKKEEVKECKLNGNYLLGVNSWAGRVSSKQDIIF